MHVQRVAMPARGSHRGGLGDDDTPIEPVERYLAYLTDVERSPNTIKAYAHDLKDYWQFLAHRGLDWREVRLEDIGEYVAWLRLPPTGRDGRSAVLPSVEPHVAASTVNRKLSALAAFYAHQVRHGVDVGNCSPPGSYPAAVVELGSRSCTTSARASRSPAARSRSRRRRSCPAS